MTLYHAHQEEQLLKTWQETGKDSAQEEYRKLDDVFGQKETETTHTPVEGELLGTLQIPKIDLLLPIVEGAGRSQLKIAAGHLTGTEPIGTKGNAAIAAHRSYTYGRQFNRLNEVTIGDQMSIDTKGKKITYTVFDKRIVAPSDTSVLQSKGNQGMITLITCEPMKHTTKRLIVQARKQS